ncbi:MAG: molybdopterin-dependent oxidoreductase, partial [Albidovulum sp.]|nr:molybdopterin-dependent oxidoreductase [Albidovulum sp.]
MNDSFTMMKRRTVLKAGGALTMSFALPEIAFGQDEVTLPRNLERNPNLASWIRIHTDGTATLLIGKVELGQGTVTAAAQCCADELQIDLARLSVISGDTIQGPNERTTAGSGSAPGCLPAVQVASAEVREILVQMAAEKLGESADGLKVSDGTITGANGSVAYWDLVDGLDLNVEPTGKAKLVPTSEHRFIGQSVTRLDIPPKMTGGEIFVQEMNPDGVVFGAIARPPTYEATLVDADLGAIEAMPGVIKVVRNGSFLGIIAEHQDQAWAAAGALSAQANWQVKSVLPTHDGIYDWLENAENVVPKELVNTAPPGEEALVYENAFYRPYHMHGSIGTSAAIAQLGSDGVMTIHNHSQSVFATATAIAKLLGMEESKVQCIHTQGSGCYGHNMADVAAADAALLAAEVPGRPV